MRTDKIVSRIKDICLPASSQQVRRMLGPLKRRVNITFKLFGSGRSIDKRAIKDGTGLVTHPMKQTQVKFR